MQIFGSSPEFMVRFEVESHTRPVTRMAEHVTFDGSVIVQVESYLGRELQEG